MLYFVLASKKLFFFHHMLQTLESRRNSFRCKKKNYEFVFFSAQMKQWWSCNLPDFCRPTSLHPEFSIQKEISFLDRRKFVFFIIFFIEENSFLYKMKIHSFAEESFFFLLKKMHFLYKRKFSLQRGLICASELWDIFFCFKQWASRFHFIVLVILLRVVEPKSNVVLHMRKTVCRGRAEFIYWEINGSNSDRYKWSIWLYLEIYLIKNAKM